jgi:hypothetical protein
VLKKKKEYQKKDRASKSLAVDLNNSGCFPSSFTEERKIVLRRKLEEKSSKYSP